jgi:hypothetical protein
VGAAPPRTEAGQVSFELTGRGQRSEVEPDLPTVQEGDQHDIIFSVRLSSDFPAHASGRQVIARWENDSPGAAPLDLRVREGQLVLHGGGGHPSGPRTFERSLGPAPNGQWCHVALRVCFSANPDTAHISAWLDGRSVLHDHHPPGGTLYPGQQSYLKVGLHRDPNVSHPATVQFRDLRIAQVRAAAHPDHRARSVSPVASGPGHRSPRPATEHPPADASTPTHATEKQRSPRSPAPQQSTVRRTPLRTTSSAHVPRNTPSGVMTTRASRPSASPHDEPQHSGPQHSASRRDHQAAGAARANDRQ